MKLTEFIIGAIIASALTIMAGSYITNYLKDAEKAKDSYNSKIEAQQRELRRVEEEME